MKNKYFLIVSLVYLISFIFNTCIYVETKNSAYISTLIWQIGAYNMLWLFFKNNEIQKERIRQRDTIIKDLFKIIHEAEEKMDSYIVNLENISLEEFQDIIKDLDFKKYHVYRKAEYKNDELCVTKWAIYKKDMPTQEYFAPENVAILSSDKDNYLDLVNFVSENKIENVEE